MNLRYKCLILDHDDTVVDSTRTIHYPVFRDVLKKLRPEITVTENDFLNFCFDPGFEEYIISNLKFTREELDFQYANWKSKTRNLIPDFFPGIREILIQFRNLGGIITVVSHNDPEIINRNYIEKTGIEPQMIFGWDENPDRRKPSVFPVLEILKYFKLKPEEALVVDDLKPGYMMAVNSGVDFAFPAWSGHSDAIVAFMRENSTYYVECIEDLNRILFN